MRTGRNVNKTIIIKLTSFLVVILLFIKACSAELDSTPAQEQNKSHEPEQNEEQYIKKPVKIHRNEDDDLVYHNEIGVYPYYPVGSRRHFCVIPIDDDVISRFMKSGTTVKESDVVILN